MLLRVLSVCIVISCWSNFSFALCNPPTPPEIPDPGSAVTAQMVKAQNDIKAYLSAAEKYLACERNDRQHDKVVEEMRAVADEFNETVRVYKERMDAS